MSLMTGIILMFLVQEYSSRTIFISCVHAIREMYSVSFSVDRYKKRTYTQTHTFFSPKEEKKKTGKEKKEEKRRIKIKKKPTAAQASEKEIPGTW